ncbi:hypothetical protein B0F90DRAFT_1750285 [Multifurca ochricompacta]|uniref:Uncharacterized protein n=1 Tax=Multifurca ochricompacta TaxID=376703 RepID=A0AAD4M102_9AGAM|nr:hypothetical protein B0F90DRAFT_1750285 [Multifurca ochricompacta]
MEPSRHTLNLKQCRHLARSVGLVVVAAIVGKSAGPRSSRDVLCRKCGMMGMWGVTWDQNKTRDREQKITRELELTIQARPGRPWTRGIPN